MGPNPRPDAESKAGKPAVPAPDPLHAKQVVLCVTGGIAVYKSVYLTRALVKAGARVFVVMSRNAARFVTPLTFETLSGNPVVTSSFERVAAMGAVEHVDLALWADLVIVAPATYNLLGKLNAGIADDAVTTFLAAVRAPVFLVPSMNDHMWRNAVNQRNVEALRSFGYRCIDPEHGALACVWEGEGRMREPDDIIDTVRTALRSGPPSLPGTPGAPEDKAGARPRPAASSTPPRRLSPAGGTESSAVAASVPAPDKGGVLTGLALLVSAGGTREAIDPVRFIGNRSSGKMGYALAAEAAARGARVVLVSGPTSLAPPPGVVETVRVETTEDMLEALQARIADADVLIMAAAVADYRPRQIATGKIKRATGPLRVELEPTPDILQALSAQKFSRFFVGFALETDDPEDEARAKLRRKGLDLVVANRVGPDTSFDTETNQVWIYDAEGLVVQTPVVEKTRVAAAILDVVAARLGRKEASARA